MPGSERYCSSERILCGVYDRVLIPAFLDPTVVDVFH